MLKQKTASLIIVLIFILAVLAITPVFASGGPPPPPPPPTLLPEGSFSGGAVGEGQFGQLSTQQLQELTKQMAGFSQLPVP